MPAGDQAARNEVFAQHRALLRGIVELRLDRRLQARIDASDVIQEAYVEAVRRSPAEIWLTREADATAWLFRRGFSIGFNRLIRPNWRNWIVNSHLPS